MLWTSRIRMPGLGRDGAIHVVPQRPPLRPWLGSVPEPVRPGERRHVIAVARERQLLRAVQVCRQLSGIAVAVGEAVGDRAALRADADRIVMRRVVGEVETTTGAGERAIDEIDKASDIRFELVVMNLGLLRG